MIGIQSHSYSGDLYIKYRSRGCRLGLVGQIISSRWSDVFSASQSGNPSNRAYIIISQLFQSAHPKQQSTTPHAQRCLHDYKSCGLPPRCPQYHAHPELPPYSRHSCSQDSKETHPSSRRSPTIPAHTTRGSDVDAVRLPARERRQGGVKRVNMPTERCRWGSRVDRRRWRLRVRRGGGINMCRE